MIILKPHNSHQVARLYGHLFCMAIDDFFYDNGLFPYVDYEYTNHTLNGVAYFKGDFFSQEAKSLAEALPEQVISLDDQDISAAILQIGAATEHSMGVEGGMTSDGILDLRAIKKELHLLDAQPWQNIADVDIINQQPIELVPGSFYIPQEKKPTPARKIRITCTLDSSFADKNKELLPLYWHLAMIITNNIKTDFYTKFGCYSKGITRQPIHAATKITLLLNMGPLPSLGASALPDAAKAAILDLYHNKAFERFVASLQTATDVQHTLPGPHYMFERTGVLIGEKGWRRVATDENCKQILSHIKVTISTGKSRRSFTVAPLLNDTKF